MCGLSGIINSGSFDSIYMSTAGCGNWNKQFKYVEEDIFDVLMLTSSLRGMHSSGVYGISPKNTQSEMYKKVMNPTDFMQTNLYESFRDSYLRKDGTLIGHSRHATIGGFSLDCAHPHKIGDITLVHNGTLSTWEHLAKHYRAVSDSEAITYALNNCSKHYTDVLSDLNGAFALIWWDGERIYITRNTERPLSYFQLENTFAISSEELFVELAVARSIGFLPPSVKRGKFQPNILYSISPGEGEFKTEVYKAYEPKKVFIYSNEYKKPTRIKEELENEYNIKKGDTIYFTPYIFELFNENKNKGLISGICLQDTKYYQEYNEISAIVYGVTDPQSLHNEAVLMGTVLDVYSAPSNNADSTFIKGMKYRIHIDSKSLQIYNFEDEK